MSEMMCEGGCMFGLALINDKQRARMIHRLKFVEEGRLRDRAYINELQKIRRPKVSGVQVDRYFGMLTLGGIDMDKDEMTDNQRRRHENLSRMSRKKWKEKKQNRKKHFAQHPSKMKKVVAKLLAAPEPNFHLPEPQGMAAQGIDKQDGEQDEK